MKPEPAPDSRLTNGTIHQPVARDSPNKPMAASPQPTISKTRVPARAPSRPLLALAMKYAVVKAASNSPRPASGACRESRMYGQATPSAPAGRPKVTNSTSGGPALIQPRAPAAGADCGALTRGKG